MTVLDRTANVLGALAGTVSDQATAAMLEAGDLPAKGSSSSLAAITLTERGASTAAALARAG